MTKYLVISSDGHAGPPAEVNREHPDADVLGTGRAASPPFGARLASGIDPTTTAIHGLDATA